MANKNQVNPNAYHPRTELQRDTHQAERHLDRRGPRRVPLELPVLRPRDPLRAPDELEHVARRNFALEERVVARVHRPERVRRVPDREDVLRRDPRRRVFLDLDLRLVVVFVFGILIFGARRETRDGAVGKGEPPEAVGEVGGGDGLRELEGAPDARHALVGAVVGDDGVREGLAEQGGVWRLPRAQKLCHVIFNGGQSDLNQKSTLRRLRLWPRTTSSARISRPLCVRTTRSPLPARTSLVLSEERSRRSPRIVQMLRVDRDDKTRLARSARYSPSSNARE